MVLRNSRGIALTTVIFITSILFVFITSALYFSSLGLKVTGAFKVSDATLQVADTGVHHALAVIPLGGGFPYTSQQEIIPSTPHPSQPGFSYSVTAINTAGGTQAILTSTARGSNGSKKVITAYIARGQFGLGATSLPGSSAAKTETNFSGTSFSINGNDNCTVPPGPAPPVPGIAVTDPALATEITNNTTADGGLASNQMGNVTGAGGTPSVGVIQPLSYTVSQMADTYLCTIVSCTNGVPPDVDCSLPGDSILCGANYSGNDNWGTVLAPRITRITGTAQISGTIEGYGVLIVDGGLDISGNFTFHGLVIARGGDIQVQVTGNAGIYGSLLIGESTAEDPGYELDIRGNAHIHYDSCALGPADGWVPLPRAAKLIAWQEVM